MTVVHLVFTCAGAVFALPIDPVKEVVQMVAPCARLPRTPRYCLGAINYHGQMVPLIDLSARLGLCAPHRFDELIDARIILVKDEPGKSSGERGGLLGYVVDSVSELSDRPFLPFSEEAERLGGLCVGTVLSQSGRNALVLNISPRTILPLLAGEKLRQALLQLQEATQREVEP
jgi:chemotaxis signal transduction protein